LQKGKEGMSDLNKALTFVFKAEGGFCNDKNDRGGATNLGIIQREYDVWRKKKGLPTQSVKNITKDEATEIYTNEYWLAGKCDKMPWPVNLAHLDACVNTGVGQAAKFLQRAVKAQDDGIIGPGTLKALGEACARDGAETVAHKIADLRVPFYDHLVEKDPTQEDFIDGWHNRVNNLKKALV
jgi:lysozyme family protein